MFTAAGALIWNIILAYGGFFLGKRITEIDKYVGPIATGCVVLIVTFYVYRLFTWKPKGKAKDDRLTYGGQRIISFCIKTCERRYG